MPRSEPASAAANVPATRGAFAAVAAVAALLLSIATLASMPGAGLAALAGQRVAVLADARAAVAPAADHPATSGVVPGLRARPDSGPRGALATRTAVMLRHTSLPPPARA